MQGSTLVGFRLAVMLLVSSCFWSHACFAGMPYDKRTYTTTATNLDTSGWVDFTVKTTQDLAWDFPPPFGM
jgi:hypothetical protein